MVTGSLIKEGKAVHFATACLCLWAAMFLLQCALESSVQQRAGCLVPFDVDISRVQGSDGAVSGQWTQHLAGPLRATGCVVGCVAGLPSQQSLLRPRCWARGSEKGQRGLGGGGRHGRESVGEPVQRQWEEGCDTQCLTFPQFCRRENRL